ncbi:MAG: hypothetical protein ACOYI5_04185 [Christensenellales bacterium]|jgi:hypothetical protein
MKTPQKRPNPDQQAPVTFDESVCSAEFPEGCTIPAADQLDDDEI